MIQEIFPHSKKIILDSNVFVVFVIGSMELSLWGKSPVDNFNRSDFLLLAKTVGEFQSAITTPYIIAEVNSLLNTTYAREACLWDSPH